MRMTVAFPLLAMMLLVATCTSSPPPLPLILGYNVESATVSVAKIDPVTNLAIPISPSCSSLPAPAQWNYRPQYFDETDVVTSAVPIPSSSSSSDDGETTKLAYLVAGGTMVATVGYTNGTNACTVSTLGLSETISSPVGVGYDASMGGLVVLAYDSEGGGSGSNNYFEMLFVSLSSGAVKSLSGGEILLDQYMLFPITMGIYDESGVFFFALDNGEVVAFNQTSITGLTPTRDPPSVFDWYTTAGSLFYNPANGGSYQALYGSAYQYDAEAQGIANLVVDFPQQTYSLSQPRELSFGPSVPQCGRALFSQDYMYAVCYNLGVGTLTYNNFVYVFPRAINPDNNVPSVYEVTNLSSILYLFPF